MRLMPATTVKVKVPRGLVEELVSLRLPSVAVVPRTALLTKPLHWPDTAEPLTD